MFYVCFDVIIGYSKNEIVTSNNPSRVRCVCVVFNCFREGSYILDPSFLSDVLRELRKHIWDFC